MAMSLLSEIWKVTKIRNVRGGKIPLSESPIATAPCNNVAAALTNPLNDPFLRNFFQKIIIHFEHIAIIRGRRNTTIALAQDHDRFAVAFFKNNRQPDTVSTSGAGGPVRLRNKFGPTYGYRSIVIVPGQK
jgi:hypothetical protein